MISGSMFGGRCLHRAKSSRPCPTKPLSRQRLKAIAWHAAPEETQLPPCTLTPKANMKIVTTRQAPAPSARPARPAIQQPPTAGGSPLSRGISSVAELADAWAFVSGKLPADLEDPGSSTGVGLIIEALKLAIAALQGYGTSPDGRTPSTRAAALAGSLAELCAAGVPLDAESIAAGVVADAAELGALDVRVIRSRLGPTVASIVHDVLRVRAAPRSVELYDDAASSAVREYCLAFTDVRSCVVEVICRWDALQHSTPLMAYDRQALALEALQIFAPLGHALGLGPVSAVMEDLCFKILFPASYAHTSAWLRSVMEPAERRLFRCQQRLLARLEQDARFKELAGSCVMRARTKSLFSLMKKLLRLDNLAAGGRRRDELHDLLGMRALVQPRTDLPEEEAEAAALQACYIVRDVATAMLEEFPERYKDYIVNPKPNGYQSLHLSLSLPPEGLGGFDYDSSTGYSHSPLGSPAYGDDDDPDGDSWSSPSPSLTGTRDSGGSGGSSHLPSHPSSRHQSHPSSPSYPDSREGGMEGGTSGRQSSTADAPSHQPSHHQPAASRQSSRQQPPPPRDSRGDAAVPPVPCVELQIRTVLMDSRAESGDAAHTAYKGGLDARQVRQLHAWTQQLKQRLAARLQKQLLLPRPTRVPPPPAAAAAARPVLLPATLAQGAQDAVVAEGASTAAAAAATEFALRAAAGGVLSPDGEFDYVSEALVAAAAATAAATTLFQSIDRDGSGSLSITELQQLLEELGSLPPAVPSKRAPAAPRLGMDMYAMGGGSGGGDGAASWGDSDDERAGAGGWGSSNREARELMALLDSDDDGGITLDEFLEFRDKAERLKTAGSDALPVSSEE